MKLFQNLFKSNKKELKVEWAQSICDTDEYKKLNLYIYPDLSELLNGIKYGRDY